jgi:hypothetical protein
MENDNKPKRYVHKNVNKTTKLSDDESTELFGSETEEANVPDGPSAAFADTPTTEADPFDPAALRLNPDTAAGAIGVKRKIVTVKVGKPNKMEFCRVHPDGAFRIDTAIVEDKTNHESYLVARALWPELPDFITLVRLCVAVNRHGTTFLWPAKLPDPNGRPMDWHTSMLQAQQLAMTSWVRVQADMSAGSYAVFEATGNLPEPEWTDLSMGELLKLAFKTRFIDSINHPFLQELAGAV